jgi:hypothetical protein
LHNVISYLWGTFFLGFITVMTIITENGDKSKHDITTKISMCGIAVFLDVFGLYAIITNKVRKRILIIVMMSVVTLLAIGIVLFLPHPPQAV